VVGSDDERPPPALATLVGALGPTGEDLRRHDTVHLAGSSTHSTTMDDGCTARERAAQVTGMQVSGAAGDGGKGMTLQLDERAVGEGDGRMSGHTASGVGRINI
jgi:hypothetical protein